MLEQGWIEEVKTLLKQQDRDKKIFTALSSIGYSQIQSYLSNKMSYEEMREDIIIKTRQYAKRQIKKLSFVYKLKLIVFKLLKTSRRNSSRLI